MAGSKLKKVKISEAELQAKYNAGKIPAGLKKGVYHLEELKGRPAPAHLNMPEGTRSVLFDIKNNNGVVLAKVHAYVRPDGTYDASGKLDPKALLFGTTLFHL